MAVISITLHKCLCFASEPCKTSPDWTFQKQPPLFFQTPCTQFVSYLVHLIYISFCLAKPWLISFHLLFTMRFAPVWVCYPSLDCQRCKFLMLPHVTELGQADLQPRGDYWKSDFKEILLWSCELEKWAHSCVCEVLVPRTEELQHAGRAAQRNS